MPRLSDVADHTSDPRVSLQDTYFPQLTCFGCGPANADGLRLKSYPADEAGTADTADTADTEDGAEAGLVVATFRPWPQHDNGVGFLNGGIISTLLDCHSAAAVTHTAHEHGWQTPDVPLPFVTAGLDVRFLRPSPLHDAVLLRAHVTQANERQVDAEVELVWDDKVRAAATAVWKRWRPR